MADTLTNVDRSPDQALFTYYVLSSLLLGPFFFVMLIPLYFRYHTLRYHFDDEGVSMRWGILFRREISLTYSRIQDIHLSSNFVERWLGLARVQVQTASGTASAEMTIEGLKDFDQIRDFLYSRMRGVRNLPSAAALHAAASSPAPVSTVVGDADDLVDLLKAIAREVRDLRKDLERTRGPEA